MTLLLLLFDDFITFSSEHSQSEMLENDRKTSFLFSPKDLAKTLHCSRVNITDV